ncbi:adenylate/guanylate cyclase with GAF sensor and FHA domain [Thalassoporum mexicanum PCC 7367]|uniref:adenylate/guanylate cyclase domain-containing protein n=1 Tax=Thalassoporum mexicanum TaxID=3457544 RepID=UPI00029FD14C|nr:adenylate/guanylate cyclase domain-containing protein [Pseudanabaena sp. PCC 7367]AFY70084.1 adenylate/guanylate cyclase with GAF sensor and FHA domain [Pseudanabaena sp. PCC 7367]
MPYLIQDPDSSDERVYNLHSGSNSLGRGYDNSIVVLDNHKSLSRHHAEIIVTGDHATLTDLNSRNHTFVNNRRIDRAELKDGDLVRCGDVVFKFLQDREFPTSPTAKPTVPPANEKAPTPTPTPMIAKLSGEHDDDDDEEIESPAGLSIVRQISPQQSRVEMQDLLNPAANPTTQGSILMLRQQDSNQRAVDKLQILLEVSKLLSEPDELEPLLDKILVLLFNIMNVDRAAILLVDRATDKLEQKAVKTRTGTATAARFYSKRITNYVRRHGDGVLIANASIDERFNLSESIVQQAIHSAMCVPMNPRDEVIGVMYVDNLSRCDVYSEEDLDFLVGLANQAAIAISNYQLYQDMQTEAIMRDKLERFFPRAVSQKLREEGNLEIVDTEVTALFCDISSFTEMSSKMEPRQVIEMLNEYFNLMVEDIVFKYEGTLEKYIGDALLAVWGAPYSETDDADRAIHAAIDMQKAVGILNQQWASRRNLEIKIHIGLNSGMVAAGNIGSDKLIQYATIGDTTNVTSRICGVAQADEIVIAQSTLERISDRSLKFEKMDLVRVKGKAEPLQLYKVLW